MSDEELRAEQRATAGDRPERERYQERLCNLGHCACGPKLEAERTAHEATVTAFGMPTEPIGYMPSATVAHHVSGEIHERVRALNHMGREFQPFYGRSEQEVMEYARSTADFLHSCRYRLLWWREHETLRFEAVPFTARFAMVEGSLAEAEREIETARAQLMVGPMAIPDVPRSLLGEGPIYTEGEA